MRKRLRSLIPIAALTLVVVACAGTAESPDTITLLAHDSFEDEVDDSTFAAFTEETGIAVEVLAGGDAGAMVTQAVLSADNPLADVLFGVDDTFLSRAIDGGIFLAHESENVTTVDSGLVHPDNLVTPISYGDVCINYDVEWFDESDLDTPTTLDDLRDPDLASGLVVMHPATSSPGLAFLLATVDIYGEDGYLDFWSDLVEGGIEVTAGWSEGYYGDFTRHGGNHPLVLSYASSPPAEVMFADPPTDVAPTGVLTEGCYRQVEYAGILDGTDYPEAAGQLIDFMLTVEFQEQIPENWFVYPANSDAELPPVFAAHTVLPEDPTRFDTEHISSNRERWINEWIAVLEGH